MNENDKVKFMVWYNAFCKKHLDLQAEMRRYCVNDVEVKGMQNILRDIGLIVYIQIESFSYATLASYCMGIFKTLETN